MWTNIKDQSIVSPTGDGSVEFKFKCSQCGSDIVTNSINIPEPNMMADNSSESEVCRVKTVVCDTDQCNEEHDLNISNGFGGMYVNIDDVNEEDIYYQSI
ncbi:MAG: hypothetical protein JKY52_14145 [Flavobacteriales bacterium]|nr:hypothetical protein [Flavobacteriales bacterium]